MRKITEQAVNAFLGNRNFKLSNMEVFINYDVTLMLLHGNVIAQINKATGNISLNHCGWQTNTTKERLNGLLDKLNKPRIYQKAFVWYWKDGEEFKDGWNRI